MNAFADAILNSTVREVIGTEIQYISPKTKRKRSGAIKSVTGSGVKVLNKDGIQEFVTYRDFIDINPAAK